MSCFYRGIIGFGDLFKHFFLLAFRLYWGYNFYLAGLGKLLNIDTAISNFSALGIPLPTFNAYFVGGVECFGGLMLLVGLGSRLAAIPLAVTMIVALFVAHLGETLAIFTSPKAFIDLPPFMYLITSLLVLSFGPGAFSVDALIKRFILKEK